MDSQLFRLNQMSYAHHKQFINSQQQQQQQARPNQAINTQNRQHYSNRQQAINALGGPIKHQQQQQTSGTSSGSEQEDQQVQLSSLSTASASHKSNNSSQAAILSPGTTSNSKMLQREQHHQMLRQQQAQQRQREQQVNAAGSQRHRQAALQAHTLASLPAGNPKSLVAHSSKQQQQQQQQSSDQLTTSSDQTIDDLHHLAPHHHHSGNTYTGTNHRHIKSRYDSSSSSNSGNRFLLGVLFTIAELLLFATVFLWLYWAYQHDDGLAWQSDRKQQFNTHAALMLFGFIFLSGQAMLIHRSFSCCSKIYTKILHTILFVLATSAISLGLILAYTAQENVGANNKPIMHFYSLHAWCGLTTVGLFVFQFVFGFVSFLILLCCDQATANYRAALLPIHKTFGLIIFSLAIATCLTGLLQTARSRLSSKLNKTDYHELAEPGIVINLIGVCLICLAILMPYIIRNLDIKRASSSFKSQFDRHLNKLSQLEMRI